MHGLRGVLLKIITVIITAVTVIVKVLQKIIRFNLTFFAHMSDTYKPLDQCSTKCGTGRNNTHIEHIIPICKPSVQYQPDTKQDCQKDYARNYCQSKGFGLPDAKNAVVNTLIKATTYDIKGIRPISTASLCISSAQRSSSSTNSSSPTITPFRTLPKFSLMPVLSFIKNAPHII
jgi:hypothetical protein